MSEATRKTVTKKAAAAKAAPAKKAAVKDPGCGCKTAPVPVPKVTAVGSEAAYLRYLPLAEKLVAGEVLPYRLDPLLAYHNVQTGLAALGPHRDALKRALPLLDHAALFDLGELAQAVVLRRRRLRQDALPRRDAHPADRGEPVAGAAARGTAEALALSGPSKAQAIDKIRSGSGPIDLARDCVELAALFGKSRRGDEGAEAGPWRAAPAGE